VLNGGFPSLAILRIVSSTEKRSVYRAKHLRCGTSRGALWFTYRPIWDEIDSPRRDSNSFAIISNAAAVQYQRLLDVSKQLRNENHGLAGENSNLNLHSRNLHAEAHARIADLEEDLRRFRDDIDAADDKRPKHNSNFTTKTGRWGYQ
jgi:hypothetical protein